MGQDSRQVRWGGNTNSKGGLTAGGTSSMRTVEGHRANLLEKLRPHTRVELVRYAREHGLLEQKTKILVLSLPP